MKYEARDALTAQLVFVEYVFTVSLFEILMDFAAHSFVYLFLAVGL